MPVGSNISGTCPSSTPWAGGPPTGTASRLLTWPGKSPTSAGSPSSVKTTRRAAITVSCSTQGIPPSAAPPTAPPGWTSQLVSLYAHPDHWGQGYGSIVMEEVLRRLGTTGYPGCFLYVLRENDHARRFYEKHGFAWDGHSLEVALTRNASLTDLRYRKRF